MNLDLYKYVYMVGIGGIGMSALARYFNSKGLGVYGYDRDESDLCKQLKEEGIEIHHIARAEDISPIIKSANPYEVLIIYTPAVSLDNLELQFFLNKGYKIYKRAEVLGIISDQSFTVAVAGTHGKTTTSAILAHILNHGGKELTAFLGGISKNYNTNLILAKKENIFIIEADEYDRSFLQLRPNIVVVTSIDSDHMEIYRTKKKLEDTFVQFVSQIKENGALILEESININFYLPKGVSKFTYSATEKADFYADNISIKYGKMNFNLLTLGVSFLDKNNKRKKEIEFVLPGNHNISNAIGASAACYCLGLDYEDIVKGLESFAGVNRRFDVLINNSDITFIDDYAHHPKEVSSTIKTTKQLFPGRSITVVFQPHLFSRTQEFAKEFATSLSLADQLILLEIYPARETPIIGVDSKMLLDLCTNPTKETCTKSELLKILRNEDLDVLLTIGAGDISDLVKPIQHMLN